MRPVTIPAGPIRSYQHSRRTKRLDHQPPVRSFKLPTCRPQTTHRNRASIPTQRTSKRTKRRSHNNPTRKRIKQQTMQTTMAIRLSKSVGMEQSVAIHRVPFVIQPHTCWCKKKEEDMSEGRRGPPEPLRGRRRWPMIHRRPPPPPPPPLWMIIMMTHLLLVIMTHLLLDRPAGNQSPKDRHTTRTTNKIYPYEWVPRARLPSVHCFLMCDPQPVILFQRKKRHQQQAIRKPTWRRFVMVVRRRL